VKKRFSLEKDARAVAACAISKDLQYIATADKHNDHRVKIFEVATGNCVLADKSGGDMIWDMCFTK